MRITKLFNRIRRDFEAIYECEHCQFTTAGYGYDDANFHQHIIPNRVCPKCKKKSPSNYEPLSPKYRADEII